MKSSKKSRTFIGVVYEGKDCSIMKEENKLTILGEFVDGAVYDFYNKKVELTITVEIKEI